MKAEGSGTHSAHKETVAYKQQRERAWHTAEGKGVARTQRVVQGNGGLVIDNTADATDGKIDTHCERHFLPHKPVGQLPTSQSASQRHSTA